MDEKKLQAANKIKQAAQQGLFWRGAKYIRFERYHGINLLEQSQRNYDALLLRLLNRTHLPGEERDSYGVERLSESESPFFQFWRSDVEPSFTSRHGCSRSFAYIKKAGGVVPVGDRRRSGSNHYNSHTGGESNQDYSYHVFGPKDNHPVPKSKSDDKILTLYFGQMTDDEKKQYAGMFIGGHLTDYCRGNFTYPIVCCGSTQVKVNYNQKKALRTTTFKRTDGTVITETLHFADEIVVADPDINTILNWLGYKLIEYLRFIGGDFQQRILASRDINVIADVFHALFPSYRFPELKIPLKKIPLNAHYLKVTSPQLVEYRAIDQFSNTCLRLDCEGIQQSLAYVNPNMPNKMNRTPIEVVLSSTGEATPNDALLEQQQRALQILLDKGADLNCYSGNESPIAQAIANRQLTLLPTLLRGTCLSIQPPIRLLPKISTVELKHVIEMHNLKLFNELYPHYLEYEKAKNLLSCAYDFLDEAHPDSLEILQRLLRDCAPTLFAEGHSYLLVAARAGNACAVKALLAHECINVNHCIINKMSDYEGWTALHFACWKGNLAVVKLLLAAGADIHATAYDGHTPYTLSQQVLAGKRNFLSGDERREYYLRWDKSAPKDLSEEKKLDYQAIGDILLAKGATIADVNEQLTKPSEFNYAACACITLRFQNRTYVLLTRKRNQFDEPHLKYRFPGGFYKSAKDQGDLLQTAIRETYEETGIDLSQAPHQLLAEYEHEQKEMGKHIRRSFFHFDIGVRNKLPSCIADGDAAEVRWVNCEEIERSEVNGELAMHYKTISVQYENAYILNAILQNEKPDRQIIIDSQRWAFEVYMIYFIAYLFKRYILNQELTNQDSDDLKLFLSQMPPGIYKVLLEKIVLAVTDKKDIQEHVKQFIAQAVKTGRVHVDEIILDGGPLIFSACKAVNENIIFWLLEMGASPNRLGGYCTPLTELIDVKAFDLAKILIEKYGANPLIGVEFHSAVSVALRPKNYSDDFVRYLLGKIGLVSDSHFSEIVSHLPALSAVKSCVEEAENCKHVINHYYIAQSIREMCRHNNVFLRIMNLLIEFDADITMCFKMNMSLVDYAHEYADANKTLNKILTEEVDIDNIPSGSWLLLCNTSVPGFRQSLNDLEQVINLLDVPRHEALSY